MVLWRLPRQAIFRNDVDLLSIIPQGTNIVKFEMSNFEHENCIGSSHLQNVGHFVL